MFQTRRTSGESVLLIQSHAGVSSYYVLRRPSSSSSVLRLLDLFLLLVGHGLAPCSCGQDTSKGFLYRAVT